MNYEDIVKQIVLADDRYIVMTAENRAVIRNLSEMLNNRFIDTGISEQTLIGIAAGLALRGRIPIVHALASFLTMRAFEFIRTDIGYPGLPVKLVAFVPGFLSEANGPTHQAIEDISLMRGIPSMQIFCPADENDLVICLPEILRSPDPFYIRLNLRKSWFRHSNSYKIGQSEVISQGSDFTLLVYGTLFTEVLEAKEVLEAQGYSVGLINLRTLKPLDEEAILQAATHSNYFVTIEDHLNCGGLYSIISELLSHHQIFQPLLPLNLNNKWFTPALLPDILEHEKCTGKAIAQRILGSIYTKDINIKVNKVGVLNA